MPSIYLHHYFSPPFGGIEDGVSNIHPPISSREKWPGADPAIFFCLSVISGPRNFLKSRVSLKLKKLALHSKSPLRPLEKEENGHSLFEQFCPLGPLREEPAIRSICLGSISINVCSESFPGAVRHQSLDEKQNWDD